MSKREDFITEFIMKNPLHIQGASNGVQLAEQALAAWRVIEEGQKLGEMDNKTLEALLLDKLSQLDRTRTRWVREQCPA